MELLALEIVTAFALLLGHFVIVVWNRLSRSTWRCGPPA